MTTVPAIEHVAPVSSQLADTPRSPRPGRLLTALLVLPAAVLLLAPFGVVAMAAAAQPGLLKVLADKPLVAFELVLGLVVSLLFCTLPFRRSAAPPVKGSP